MATPHTRTHDPRQFRKDHNVYVQCIGTLDRNTFTISASCDSAEVVDDDLTVSIDDVCDLNDILTVDVGIF